jgi:flagellar motor switch protein FliM
MTSFVEITAEIGCLTLPFSDLMSLKEGDVLTLDKCATDELTLKIAEIPKFKGMPGYSRGNQAIRVTKTIT